MWWICYRTQTPGTFNQKDKKEWRQCGVKYILFFDHVKDDAARLFVMGIMERNSHFKAAKVSKFARDGEKVIVLLGKDHSHRKLIEYAAKECGFAFWKVIGLDDQTSLEQHMNDKYSEYLNCLANAFRGNESDGSVRFNGVF